MKILLISLLICFTITRVHAECPDYRSSMQDMQTSVSTTLKLLKKALKSDDYPKAQTLLDKAIVESESLQYAALQAKQYAQECSCPEGEQIAASLFELAFDIKELLKKAVDNGSFVNAVPLIEKAVEGIEFAQSKVNDGLFACE